MILCVQQVADPTSRGDLLFLSYEKNDFKAPSRAA